MTADTTVVPAPGPAVSDTVVKTTTTMVDTIHGQAPDTSRASAQDTSSKGAKGMSH